MKSDSVMQSVDQSRLLRRITMRLVPFLGFIYLIAYIDRQNVSFAKLQMVGDLFDQASRENADTFIFDFFVVRPDRFGARIARQDRGVGDADLNFGPRKVAGR